MCVCVRVCARLRFGIAVCRVIVYTRCLFIDVIFDDILKEHKVA